MTRNIDVYKGRPDEAIKAFKAEDKAGLTNKGVDASNRYLLERFMLWLSTPALYQEEEPKTNEDSIAESLRWIAESLNAIAFIKGAPVRRMI